jgi:hypothetical protein
MSIRRTILYNDEAVKCGVGPLDWTIGMSLADFDIIAGNQIRTGKPT